MRSVLIFILLVAGIASAQPTGPHTFAVANGQFQLDGRPYQILSGEMHYPRVPRAYWRDRFRKARAMGLNTITTYVFWNLHEPAPRRLRLQWSERRRRVHSGGPTGGTERHPASRPLRLRGMGPRRLSIVAPQGPQTHPAFHRPQIHRRHERLVRPARQGNFAAADPARRPHHRRPGRKRIRLIRQRQRVHGSSENARCLNQAWLHPTPCFTPPMAREQVPTVHFLTLPARHQFRHRRRRTGLLCCAKKLRPGRSLHVRRILGRLV